MRCGEGAQRTIAMLGTFVILGLKAGSRALASMVQVGHYSGGESGGFLRMRILTAR